MNRERRQPFTRLFVFDHGFGNQSGHWPHLHRTIVDESRRHALEPLIFGYREIRRALVGDLPARPLFRVGPGDTVSHNILENHRWRNQAFLADLATLDPADFGPEDVFLFTFVLNYELEAILTFSARFDPARKPVFLVCLQFDNGLPRAAVPGLPAIIRFDRWLKRLVGRNGGGDAQTVVRLYRQCLRAAPQRRSLARLAFMSPHGLHAAFAKALRRTVHPYCMPGPSPEGRHTLPATAAAEPAREGLTVSFLGHSCQRKGLQFVPGLIRAVRVAQLDVRFEIQVNYQPDDPNAGLFDRLFERAPEGATLHRGHLDAEAYAALLARSDIVLMPYDSDVYRYMPSGLLAEAIGAGKVVVVPDQTSLASYANAVDAAAVTFSDFSESAVIEAMFRALADYEPLRARASAAAPRWRERHNSALFVRQLLEQAALTGALDHGAAGGQPAPRRSIES